MRPVWNIALSCGLLLSAAAAQAADRQAEQAAQADGQYQVPEAPKVTPPGWPPPENLCGVAKSYDFDKDPLNPGLYTAEQYRTWAIGGYDRKDADQIFFLGLMYEYGHNVRQDAGKAKELYQQAAKAGQTRAKVRLGKYYCARELYCSAARYFYDAAIDDSGEGQMGLSKLYRWGLGVYYDPIEAYRWGYLAMEKTEGNWLVHNMGGVEYLRDIQDHLTSEEETQASKMIDKWKRGLDVHVLKCKVDE